MLPHLLLTNLRKTSFAILLSWLYLVLALCLFTNGTPFQISSKISGGRFYLLVVRHIFYLAQFLLLALSFVFGLVTLIFVRVVLGR